jgi:1-deoxy-D-xylulose-5-phosphate synthase
VYYKDGPIALRYPRGSAIGVELKDGFETLSIGKGEVVKKGDNIALLAVGNMVQYSLEAAGLLKEDGISAEVINMRFIKPLDQVLLKKVADKFDKIVTLEENSLDGGFGSAVLEYLNSKNINVDLLRIGIPDKFIDHGTQAELHNMIEIDPNGIHKKVLEFYNSK